MSTGEEQDQPAEPEPEPRQMSERTAKAILCFLGLGAMWGLVAAFPWIAYVIVGSIMTVGVQRARARWGRTGDEDQEQQEQAAPDVVAALHRLIGDDKGVLLTTLQKDLKLPDTKAVKQLLDAESVPYKAGRTRGGNGPSVRKEDIPPDSSPAAEQSQGMGCCCRSGDNSNDNNASEAKSEEELRVVRTDTDVTIHKPAKPTAGHSCNGG